MATRTQLRLASLLVLRRRRRRREKNTERSCWTKPWVSRRKDLGVYSTLLRELSGEDPETFRQYHRVTIDQFHEILNVVAPLIVKQDTIMRESIKPGERLAATLRFLATGETFRSIQYQYRIGERTISDIVIETCKAIYEGFKDECFQIPSSQEEWMQISDDFNSKWNYPGCIGALDGKHIRIRQPPETGSQYFNYKKFFSILMLALVDANYKFLYVDVGAPGRAGDAGVYSQSSLKDAITNDSLNLPPSVNVHGMPEKLPLHIIGDDAFPLSEHLMKPYPQRHLDHPKRIFNYRFSRARRVVENAFGILANRWRVFLTTIQLSPEKVTWLIMAACTLHNMLVEKNKNSYLSALDVEGADGFLPGAWRTDPQLVGMRPADQGRNPTRGAKQQRSNLTNYFLGAGSVHWQERMISVNCH